MGIITANGLHIAYERVGRGPPLVLLHGAAADGRIWKPQIDGLADDFTVIAWDEPGTGRSDDLPEGFELGGYADCLAELVEALVVEPAHILGLSWGGTLALELHRRRPQLVASLVLADTYAGWKGSLPGAEVRARVAGAEAMLAASPDQFDPTLPGLFAGDPPAEYVPLLGAISASVRPASLRCQVATMAATDLNEVLPQIAVPTLLIWGDLDARSPLAIARRFEQEIAGSRLALLRGAGHVSNLERPDEFNAAVREFCLEDPENALPE